MHDLNVHKSDNMHIDLSEDIRKSLSSDIVTTLFRVNDLSQAQELIANKICPHDINIVEDHDKLDVHFKGMMKKSMQLMSISYGAHVDITPTENQNYYFTHSMLSGTSCVYRNQKIVPTKVGQTVVVSPNTQYHFKLPTHSKRVVIAIERDIMIDYLESILEEPVAKAPVFDLNVPEQSHLQIWINHVFNVSNILVQQPMMMKNRKLFQSQLESTMSLMLSLFEHNYSDKLRHQPDQATPSRINRAKDYIYENIKEPLTVLQVAKATGVSARSLQYAFRDIVQLSPAQFIKFHKIKAVHEVLKKADPNQQVSRILLDFNIPSMGHFAKSYKEVYGCSPKDTLKKKAIL